MKKMFLLPASLLVLLVFAGCSKSSTTTSILGVWSHKADFEGSGRDGAVSFVINGYAYVGFGTAGVSQYTSSANPQTGQNNFYQLNPSKGTWRQVRGPRLANGTYAPGRNQAVAFVVNGKAYVGTGIGGVGGVDYLKDFWEFTPPTTAAAADSGSWRQVADFAGSSRRGAVAFAINGKGYVGTGYDGSSKRDFWEYDPSTNAWTQRASFGGAKRSNAAAFVVNNQGYIFTGADAGSYPSDVYSYDPTSDTWTQRRSLVIHPDAPDDSYDFSGVLRAYAVGFTVNEVGYVATGSYGSTLLTCWGYNATADVWYQKTNFGVESTGIIGSGRNYAVGFGIDDPNNSANSRGYVTTGLTGSIPTGETWVFQPDAANE